MEPKNEKQPKTTQIRPIRSFQESLQRVLKRDKKALELLRKR